MLRSAFHVVFGWAALIPIIGFSFLDDFLPSAYLCTAFDQKIAVFI